MSEANLLHFDDIPQIERGGGIYSTPFFTKSNGATVFSSGTTTFPQGATIAEHTHNVVEQVVLLEGEGIAEIEGRQENVKALDTTYIPAGVPHRFINRGSGSMRILWIYGSTNVTRTYTATGEETDQFGELSQSA